MALPQNGVAGRAWRVASRWSLRYGREGKRNSPLAEADDTVLTPAKRRAGGGDLERLAVPELVALRAAVDATLQRKQEEAKAALPAKWQAEAAENTLSRESILEGQQPQPVQGQGRKARRRTGGTVTAKFRNPETGQT